MKSVLITIIACCTLCACYQPKSGDRQREAIAKANPKTLLEELEQQKQLIDTAWVRDTNCISVYVTRTDQKKPVKIEGSKFEGDSIDYVYSVLAYGEKVRSISFTQYDNDGSGDADIRFTYYFDDKGKTFAHQYNGYYFGGLPDDGVIIKSQTRYFDQNFKKLKVKEKLADDKGNKLGRGYKVDVPSDFDTTYPNVVACLKAYSIKL